MKNRLSELAYFQRLNKQFEQLAKNDDACAYCGLLATDDEHIIPYSYLVPIATAKRKAYKSFKKYIVRSCSNCNHIAGSKVFQNFWEKKKYIADRVRVKNKKLLAMPEWTDSEMQELEGRLMQHIYTQHINKKILLLRLENLEKPEIIEYKEIND